jgi:hypothetical protein
VAGWGTCAWLVPQPVIAEVCYLLGREHGSQAEAAFLRWFGRRELTLVPLTVTDTDRMAELVDTYASPRLGGRGRVGDRDSRAAERGYHRDRESPRFHRRQAAARPTANL